MNINTRENTEVNTETKVFLILKDKDYVDGSLSKRINGFLNLNNSEHSTESNLKDIRLVEVKYPFVNLRITNIEEKLTNLKFIELIQTFSSFDILIKDSEYEDSLIKSLIFKLSQFLDYKTE